MRKTNASSTQSLSEIRRKLRRGERTMIANMCNISNTQVTRVLNGEQHNALIIKEANKITRRRR